MTFLGQTQSEWKDIFELLSYMTVVFGGPVAIFQYRRAKHKEQQDREYGTYNALDEKYLQFQTMCFEHPELDIFDVPDRSPKPLSEEQAKQELIAFTQLISIFERAFLMYHDQSTKIKRAQWTGWDEYIRHYCQRQNFIYAWEMNGTTFDLDFENYMETIIAANLPSSRSELLSPVAESDASYTFKPIKSAADVDFLHALRVAGQYGWHGGALSGNELSFLIDTPIPGLNFAAFVLKEGDSVRSLAAASFLSSGVLLIHDVTVAPTIHREALFEITFKHLRSVFSAPKLIAAEVVENEPRHLKTEIFMRGLTRLGFHALKTRYQLPSHFNARPSPINGTLFVAGSSDLSPTRLIECIYAEFYATVWEVITGGRQPILAELRTFVGPPDDANAS